MSFLVFCQSEHEPSRASRLCRPRTLSREGAAASRGIRLLAERSHSGSANIGFNAKNINLTINAIDFRHLSGHVGPEMPADRYIVQPVPNGLFRVWDTKAQGVVYLPGTLSDTTSSRAQAEEYARRLNDRASAIAALRGDSHEPH